ncbi:MAG: septal ring lytic transglycosylase RlpA family protein [Candidatus Sericytochromatia bacterium]
MTLKHLTRSLAAVTLLFGVSLAPASAAGSSLGVGLASYYSPRFHGTCCTANGERVNIYSMTAAHRTLPFGSRVRVTNLKNGRSVVVRINDRGPYHGSRIIDLSKSAFNSIGRIQKGVIKVKLEKL